MAKKKKKNTFLTVLVILLLVLVLAAAGVLGWLWYRENHIFVEGKAYSIHATELDLREQDITFGHYDAVHAQLPECRILWNVPFQNKKYSNDSEELFLSGLTREDMDVMQEYFPRLKKVNAAKCDDYAMLEELMERLPGLEVGYTVNLGGRDYSPNSIELELEKGDYRLETLKENLPYLHQLTDVLFITPEFGMDEVEALRESFPEVTFRYTVGLLGKEYDSEITSLDLSKLTSDQVEEVCEKLPLLPRLESIELVDGEGRCALEKEAVKTLVAAAPNVVFHYEFDFYGQTLSTDTEEVVLTNVKIGDEGEEDIRFALDMMTNCKRFVLDRCGVSNEVMAQIREDYRDRTKVVWRVFYGKGGSLTDVDVIRCVYDLVDDNAHDLVYCEDVRYIDFGHDEFLDSFDFVAGMPKLEYAIISGSPIKDLTPFSGCKNLKVLEAAFCEYLTDVSPLASCENLEMLNISYTHIADLSPIDDLKLTTLFAIHMYGSRVPEEERARYDEAHPDVLTKYSGKDTEVYGEGWRYNGNDKMEWYALIAEAFRYPDAPNHVGWYFDK